MPTASIQAASQTKSEEPAVEEKPSFWHRAEGSVIAWSWVLVGTFGFLQAVANRFFVNPDGVSYADLADAFVRGDWHHAISAYWGPLYPFILSVVFRVFHPSAYFESTLIHLVNFFLYLISFGALQFLIFEVAAVQASKSALSVKVCFPRPALLLLGTILFLISSEHYLSLALVTPDFCVMTVAFLASTLVLRMRRVGPKYGHAAVLGAVLALGYLAKAAFFPLSFAFLAAALAQRTDYRRVLQLTGVALAAFFLIAGPNVIAISASKHYLTFADTGKLNYIWYVDGMSQSHFQVFGDAGGTPVHPTRQVFQHPNVYEFATPVQGTYPVWFDPSYWHEGVRPTFVLRRQLHVLRLGSEAYRTLFAAINPILFVFLLLMVVQTTSAGSPLPDFWAHWRIVIPSVAALLLYLPVLVEGRYVSPFIIMLCIVLYSSIHLPAGSISRNLLSASVVVLVVAAAVNFYPAFSRNLQATSEGSSNMSWEIASGLRDDFHLQRDDAVACFGYCFDSYWARLAKVRIVSEMPSSQVPLYLRSTESTRRAALQVIAATGAKVIVADTNPGLGWMPVKGTNYFVYDLR